MNASNDPTMSTNAGLEQKGKLTHCEIEYILRDIEENNFDRTSFNARGQLWEKNKAVYGESGSESRRMFIRFVSNTVKRHSWKNYADLLKEFDEFTLYNIKDRRPIVHYLILNSTCNC